MLYDFTAGCEMRKCKKDPMHKVQKCRNVSLRFRLGLEFESELRLKQVQCRRPRTFTCLSYPLSAVL